MHHKNHISIEVFYGNASKEVKQDIFQLNEIAERKKKIKEKINERRLKILKILK